MVNTEEGQWKIKSGRAELNSEGVLLQALMHNAKYFKEQSSYKTLIELDRNNLA